MEVEIVRKIEAIYSKGAFYCNQVCSDPTACNGPGPEGACQTDP